MVDNNDNADENDNDDSCDSPSQQTPGATGQVRRIVGLTDKIKTYK